MAAPASAAGPELSHADAVRALHAAEGVFAVPLSTASSPGRDATAALRDLAVALPELGRAQRRRGRALLARPTDPGRQYFGKEADGSPVCDASFCVHWSAKQHNAPASADFIDEVIASTSLTYGVENGTLGWKPPKSDGGRGQRNGVGGEGQVDVYITNLGKRLYGYAAPDPGQSGARRFAYLVLDNNYLGFPSPPLDSLRVTVAHEYNHILQFNYDTFEDVWMFESTATWAEQQVYPDINDYLNYLPTFAKQSASPMTGKDIKIYAEAVWNHWLGARFGQESVRDAWAASQRGTKPPHHATSAYTASIRAHGQGSFSTEFGAFAAATAEWRSNPSFPDAGAYPEMRRKGTMGARARTVTLDNTSYRLVNVRPDGTAPISLRVKAPHGVASTVALVGRVGGVENGTVTTELRQLPKGGRGAVVLDDPSAYERITAVIVNGDGAVSRRGRYLADDAEYRYALR